MEEGPESQKEKGNNESTHKESDDTSKELQNQSPSVPLATKVKSPKAKENRKNESNNKENNDNSKKKKNKNPTMIPATKTKTQKQKKKEKVSQMFVRDEITNNKQASDLISDLVNCYTCNCNLPQKELDNLNKTLYEKTVTLFLQILNQCVKKIFNKLLDSDIFKETFLSKKVDTKNVLCQTDVTYTDY